MKLSRPAAVFAAVVLLAGGAAVAVNAGTTTAPITLCSNAKTSAVTVPSPSGCAKGTTAFTVASAADVQALAGRLDTAETTVSALQTTVQELEAALEPPTLSLSGATHTAGLNWYYTISGTNLQPGAPVTIHYTSQFGEGSASQGSVAAEGTFQLTNNASCSATNWYVTTINRFGAPIKSNVVASGTDC